MNEFNNNQEYGSNVYGQDSTQFNGNQNLYGGQQGYTQFAPNSQQQNGTSGFCIASLVLGILSVFTICCGYFGLICPVLAIIFGIIGIKRSGRGMAIAGIACAVLALIVCIIFIRMATATTEFTIEGIQELFEQLESME